MKKLLALTLALSGALLLTTSALLPDGLGIGDQAPDFKLKNVDGKKYALADIKEDRKSVV